jgi:hypothetical protein
MWANHDRKRANRSFENVAYLKYSGMAVSILFRRKLRAD